MTKMLIFPLFQILKLSQWFVHLLYWSTGEPGVLQKSLASLQNLSCTLQCWDDLTFRQKHNYYHSSSKCEQPWRTQGRRTAIWFWYHSGSERLSYSLPLSEDSMTCTSPLSRSRQTILVRCAGTKDHLHPEHRITQEQAGEVWSNADLGLEIYHWGFHIVKMAFSDEVNLPPQPWNPGMGCNVSVEQPVVGVDSWREIKALYMCKRTQGKGAGFRMMFTFACFSSSHTQWLPAFFPLMEDNSDLDMIKKI